MRTKVIQSVKRKEDGFTGRRCETLHVVLHIGHEEHDELTDVVGGRKEASVVRQFL